MFAVKNISEQGFDKVILVDKNESTSIEIIPSCGAILYAFNVLLDNTLFNIIDNYVNIGDFKDNVECKGFKSCKLSPFACRVNKAKYRFGEKIYIIEKFLLNGDAIHGLLYAADFVIINQEANQEYARVTLLHHYKATDKGYPFYFDCIITYELKKNNLLTLTTQIINKSDGLIPVQDGWHPYFTFGSSINELQLEFQSKEILEFNNELIPTGNLLAYDKFCSLKKIEHTVFDNCFTVNFSECQPLCVVRDTYKKIQLEIYPGKGYPYLQIYTPSHRNSISIENLSAAPDAFNNGLGLVVLQPAEKAVFETSFKISLL